MIETIDNVVPKEKWEFDSDVADCFENMLQRSIPQYDVMRDSSARLIKDILRLTNKTDNFNLLDIGCSDGLMIEKLLQTLDNKGKYIGIDVSEPMIEKARCRFLNNFNVNINYCDIRTDFPKNSYDVITAILSIQFTPIEYRQAIISNIYENLVPDKGCFIMVEKVLGNTHRLNELFVDNYYTLKKEHGYSQDQIDRKKLSLEGVLVPVTSDWNIDLLKQAGFREVDVFWRWMNFVGYIAIK